MSMIPWFVFILFLALCEGTPLPEPSPAAEHEPLSVSIVAVDDGLQSAHVSAAQIATGGDNSGVRSQRSPIFGLLGHGGGYKSHHHHYGGGGGDFYQSHHHHHGGGGDAGSYASAGSYGGGYGGGSGSHSHASSNSANFYTPFGGISFSESEANSNSGSDWW